MSAKVHLTLACGDYEIIRALKEGTVRPDGIELNLVLCVFNLIPIPPLDGSRVADGLVPYRLRHHWENFTQYSWIALLAVIVLGGSYLAVPIGWLDDQLRELIWFIAGR